MKALEHKQKAFVAEYAKDHNGTRAAIRAGYSRHTAGAQAARLLQKANVKEILAKQEAKAEEKAIVTLTMWLKRLKQLGIEGDPKFSTTGQALQMLGKHFKWLVERMEHSGANGTPLEVQIYLPDNHRNPPKK